ncbi:unnamed protein product [Linum trigynum]|uniref:Uncharacterized protein n=1 Tax=Linum trigynum TaxID=586398 RepID=A0AAV2FTD6_9ROSI
MPADAAVLCSCLQKDRSASPLLSPLATVAASRSHRLIVLPPLCRRLHPYRCALLCPLARHSSLAIALVAVGRAEPR